MNETIGVKGGKNDRRRTIKIKEAKKKKLEENEKDLELRKLEKEVQKQQVITLIKTLPIVVAGGTFKVLYDTATGKKPIDKEEYNSKWRIKEYDTDHTTLQHGEKPKERKVIVTPSGEKVVVYVDIEEKKNILEDILVLPKPNHVAVDDNTYSNDKVDVLDDTDTNVKTTSNGKKIKTTNQAIYNVDKKSQNDIKESDIYQLDNRSIDLDFANLSPASKETLGKLKARKILDEYEKKLKDVRFDLRQLIYDYNALVDASDETILSSDAQIILDRLSDIISRIEELKARIKIEDLDKYDDNYIYTLVEGYLAEFKDKKLVAEMKDSPLYVLIAEKLDELDTKRTNLGKQVEKKKEDLEEKEEKFSELKKKYNNVERFNDEIAKFQKEQDYILSQLKEKIRTAESIEEKVRVEVQVMDSQSRRALRLLRLQMMFPGSRVAKGISTTAASYLYLLDRILRPRTITKKYKEIKVIDYSSEITNSISMLEDAASTLGKTSYQVEKMISLIKSEYGDYLSEIPECAELLSNLNKIKQDLDEKEYEMERLKDQQRLLLEKNNAKVKKRGEYPM